MHTIKHWLSYILHKLIERTLSSILSYTCHLFKSSCIANTDSRALISGNLAKPKPQSTSFAVTGSNKSHTTVKIGSIRRKYCHDFIAPMSAPKSGAILREIPWQKTQLLAAKPRNNLATLKNRAPFWPLLKLKKSDVKGGYTVNVKSRESEEDIQTRFRLKSTHHGTKRGEFGDCH